MKLQFLDLDLSIVRLPAGEPFPESIRDSVFLSVTRTPEETSIVCETKFAPPGAQSSSGWSVFRVAGSLDISLTGILSRISAPLAEARISIFAVSTYDTDYVLIRKEDRDRARLALASRFQLAGF